MKDPCEDMTKEEIRIVFGICIKALKINSNFDRLCIGAILPPEVNYCNYHHIEFLRIGVICVGFTGKMFVHLLSAVITQSGINR